MNVHSLQIKARAQICQGITFIEKNRILIITAHNIIWEIGYGADIWAIGGSNRGDKSKKNVMFMRVSQENFSNFSVL